MAVYILQVTSGPSSGVSVSFFGGSVTIGRDPSSNLCINDSNVSRAHAQLTDNGREVVLRDLNSTNGTTLNGRRVTDAVIRPGDIIHVGNSQVQLSEAQQSPGHTVAGAYSQQPPPASPPRRERYPNRLESGPRNYSLQVTSGQSAGVSVSFSRGSVTVGRDPSSDLRVDDMQVSRSHVRLTHDGREVVLRDMHSTNGTTLNGRRVTEAVIRPGDVIGIGDSQIQFAEVQLSSRPAARGAYSQQQQPMSAQRRPLQPLPERRLRQDPYPPPRPAAASSTNWGTVLLVILILGAIGGAIYWFYNMTPRSDEEIAAQVAVEWTNDSVDEVTGQAMRVLTGTTLGSGFLADQINERVTWTHSEPECPRPGRCVVLATARASSPFSFSIPVALDIDTGGKRVDNWEIQFAQVSLAGIPGGAVIGGANEAASDALERFNDFVSDGNYDDAYEVIEGFGDFFSDEDIEDAFESVESFGDFFSDEDLEDAFESVESFGDFFSDDDYSDFDDDIDNFSDSASDVADTIGSFFR